MKSKEKWGNVHEKVKKSGDIVEKGGGKTRNVTSYVSFASAMVINNNKRSHVIISG